MGSRKDSTAAWVGLGFVGLAVLGVLGWMLADYNRLQREQEHARAMHEIEISIEPTCRKLYEKTGKADVQCAKVLRIAPTEGPLAPNVAD